MATTFRKNSAKRTDELVVAQRKLSVVTHKKQQDEERARKHIELVQKRSWKQTATVEERVRKLENERCLHGV